jgi:hypothetical protein
MDGWRTAYEWARGIFAVLGLIGCSLLALLFAVVFASNWDTPESPGTPPVPTGTAATVDPLAGADSLLDEAGIVRDEQKLALVASHPGRWLDGGAGHVEAWCLRAPGLAIGPRWLRPEELEPLLLLAVARSVQTANGAQACVPTWEEVNERRMAVQPMQLVFSQRQLGFARLALYDGEGGMLYLISRSIPTAPPTPAPTPAAPSPG